MARIVATVWSVMLFEALSTSVCNGQLLVVNDSKPQRHSTPNATGSAANVTRSNLANRHAKSSVDNQRKSITRKVTELTPMFEDEILDYFTVTNSPAATTGEPSTRPAVTSPIVPPSTPANTTTSHHATFSPPPPSPATPTDVPTVARPAPTASPTAPPCSQYDSFDLYRLLERVGGRNQRFMADSPEEAGHAFAQDLRPPPQGETATPNAPRTLRDDPNVVEAADYEDVTPPRCEGACATIRARLNDALLQSSVRQAAADAPYSSWDDAVSRERNTNEGDTARQASRTEAGGQDDGGCRLDNFIALGDCSGRGTERDLWGYERLCSACQGVFMLSRRCFPRFFNAVRCNRDDARCIFDWWTNAAHGKCQARTLAFTVLRNVGTDDCQHWVYEHLSVPISCECYLSKTSWLRA